MGSVGVARTVDHVSSMGVLETKTSSWGHSHCQQPWWTTHAGLANLLAFIFFGVSKALVVSMPEKVTLPGSRGCNQLQSYRLDIQVPRLIKPFILGNIA